VGAQQAGRAGAQQAGRAGAQQVGLVGAQQAGRAGVDPARLPDSWCVAKAREEEAAASVLDSREGSRLSGGTKFYAKIVNLLVFK
jgi:hypothetical protein